MPVINPSTCRKVASSSTGFLWSYSGDQIWPSSSSAFAASSKRYTFDRVFAPDDDNGRVNGFVDGLGATVAQGFNATIFAYGQTASGKTHTMLGTPNEPGIIRDAVEQIFRHIEENRETKQFLIRVSYIEIYNEKICDLLTPVSQYLSACTCT